MFGLQVTTRWFRRVRGFEAGDTSGVVPRGWGASSPRSDPADEDVHARSAPLPAFIVPVHRHASHVLTNGTLPHPRGGQVIVRTASASSTQMKIRWDDGL